MRPILPVGFSGFGVALRALKRDDLPLLLRARNDPAILPYMDDTRAVSLSVLEFWYKKFLKSSGAFSFLVYLADAPIGYIDLRECDYENRRCVDGIYLFENRFRGVGLGSRVWLCREMILNGLGLDDIDSFIRPNNTRSIAFFKKMGAKFIRRQNDFLTFRQNLRDRRAALRKAAVELRLEGEYESIYG